MATKINKQTAPQMTAEEINKQMAEMQARLAELKALSITPALDRYHKAEAEVIAARNAILEINPDWKAPKIQERIVSFLKANANASKKDIFGAFGKVGGKLNRFATGSKAVKAGKVSALWAVKDGKYSLTEAASETVKA